MNVIELQERLKDLPETALMQEMQMPSGTAPQYLVLSELKRRKRMRDEYQRQQAQGMQTVAEETISAAGMPQQGIMGLAQGMAPRSAIAQDTGVNDMMQQESVRAPQPEQPMMMADGGYVQRMQEGGRTEEPGFVQRLLEDIKRRIRAGRMSEEEARFVIQNYGILPEALSPVNAAMDAVRLAEEGDYPGSAINAASAFPLGRIVGPAMNVAAELYNRAGDREIEPVSEFPVGMADGGYVQRMRKGGFGDNVEYDYAAFLAEMGLSDTPDNRDAFRRYQERMNAQFALRGPNTDPRLFGPEEQRMFIRDIDEERYAGPGQPAIGDVSADVGAFLPGASAAPPMMSAPSALGPAPSAGAVDFDASIAEVPPQPAPREPESYFGTMARITGEAANVARGMGIPIPESQPGINIDDIVSPGDLEFGTPPAPSEGGDRRPILPQRLRDAIDTYRAAPDINIEDIVGVGDLEYGGVETPSESDFSLQRLIDDLGFGPAMEKVAESQAAGERREREAAEARAAEAARMMEINEIPATERRVDDSGEVITPPAPTPLISDADTGGGTGGGGTGGGAGGFGPIESRIARMLEEREKSAEADKWLSLAQTGLALMASDQPTLGGAIGEAGLAGIGALQQARSQYDKDIMELLDMQAGVQRARAAGARAGEGGTASATERAAYFRAANEAEAEVARLERELVLGGEVGQFGEIVRPYSPEELALLNRQLNSARSRASVYSGLSNPALATIQAMNE